MPNDDGEFYQFCYVTHKGEIRGASTPFQFRANSPSVDELLTVEEECNSDILVVTTKAGFLEVSMVAITVFIGCTCYMSFNLHVHIILNISVMQQKVEETQREKEELVKKLALLQQEKEQLEAEQEHLKKECDQEKESCVQLRRENQVSWKRTKLQS